MVVCKFFLQGYCKFGETCRYQHYEDNRSQIANYRNHNRSWQSPNYTHGGRANNQLNAFPSQTAATPGHLNPMDLCTAIKDDVIAMEEGGQWPLSCYTPLKDVGCFPGFHDTSMEEVRYDAYQAQASGTFDQYVKKIGNLIQATRMKWNMLKNPTGQVMNVIEKMARGQMTDAPGQPSFSLQHTLPFSSGLNSGFPAGGGPSSMASSFRFALPSTDSSSSAFPNSTFGQSGAMVCEVGGPMADVALPMVTTAVGGDAPHVATGFFGSKSVFGSTSKPEESTLWPSNTASSHKTFQPVLADANVYTKLVDLNVAEKKEFTAMTFTLGSVPLRPPPCELCS